MTLPEQGGFNEKLDAIIVELQVSIGKGLTKSSDLYKAKHEAKTAIRTLVLEEIIGENELSYSIPQGMPESVYSRFKGADKLREEQRLKLGGTHGTK